MRTLLCIYFLFSKCSPDLLQPTPSGSESEAEEVVKEKSEKSKSKHKSKSREKKEKREKREAVDYDDGKLSESGSEEGETRSPVPSKKKKVHRH